MEAMFWAVWVPMGLVGTVLLWRKGYLGFFRSVGKIGCVGFMLYGWAVALMIVLVPSIFLIMCGGITLLAGWKLPSKHLSDHVPVGSYKPRGDA